MSISRRDREVRMVVCGGGVGVVVVSCWFEGVVGVGEEDVGWRFREERPFVRSGSSEAWRGRGVAMGSGVDESTSSSSSSEGGSSV